MSFQMQCNGKNIEISTTQRYIIFMRLMLPCIICIQAMILKKKTPLGSILLQVSMSHVVHADVELTLSVQQQH